MGAEIETLRTIPFFKGLGAKQWEAIAQGCRQESHKQGATVVEKGEESKGMYIIVSGEVTVLRGADKVATLKANDFFGELALLSAKPRTATVRASSESLTVLFLPTATFNYIKFGLPTEVLDEISKRIKENSGVGS
ncbi:MAG: cyclic nucleotide-binding domain-containing protein [Patescibacteria group bacterium]